MRMRIDAQLCISDISNMCAVRRVQLVKPEKSEQVENAILARAQRGQISEKVSEDVIIQMLQASGGSGGERGGSGVKFKRRDLEDDDEW